MADNLDAASNLFSGTGAVDTAWGLSTTTGWKRKPAKSWRVSTPTFKKLKEPVSALSGGQRQSVAIARAVYFNAKILIMDEPTAALGVHETAMVAELIQELKKQGLGIFLISHDTREMMELCDRVAVMKNGKMVGTERVEDVTEDDISVDDHSRQEPKGSSMKFIGLDLGTSSLKAILIDENQHILGEHAVPLTVTRPHSGWSEQDPQTWCDAAISGTVRTGGDATIVAM